MNEIGGMEFAADMSSIDHRRASSIAKRPNKILRMSKASIKNIKTGFRKVKRAGGKVSKKVGFNFSESHKLALLKK